MISFLCGWTRRPPPPRTGEDMFPLSAKHRFLPRKTVLSSPQNGAFLPAKQCFPKENNIFSDKFSIGNYVFSEIMLFFAA